MKDKRCLYWLNGWREWVECPASLSRPPVRQWSPAGTLAAQVLRFPRVVRSGRWKDMPQEMWAEMMRGETDEARLRAAYPNLPLVEESCAALLAARQMVDVTERYDRVEAELSRKTVGASYLASFTSLRALRSPEISLTRDEIAILVTPGEAVFTSLAAGLSRGTLGLCGSTARDGGCARLVAFPRVGFSYKYCEDCRRLGRDTRARLPRRGGPEVLDTVKQDLWKSGSMRVYKRLLRDEWAERGHRPTSRPGRWKRKRLTLPRQQEWEKWRLPAWNALLQANTPAELDAWEAEFAPAQKRGPRAKLPRRTES